MRLLKELIPEACWVVWIVVIADNINRQSWHDPIVLAEITLLSVIGLWALRKRWKESIRSTLYAALYLLSTSVLVIIQNSSWTRIAVLIIFVSYLWGRTYRHQQQKTM
ncbi:putative membrane protein [Arcanobacterium pluranimalium]|uniref:hypothetical protein n=1 Tax=Arcanobacterium pluranimalium TaxID=108028 RepID=UPI0019576906|nr:hypothetical protein [Arcanobacterium pluranimalium]MBM7824550.1 putative membrane protein [Arcanobacterium pluranimalium]